MLFLHLDSNFDLASQNEQRATRFLLNLEFRLKITMFVLLQRLVDDEQLNRIA